MIVPKSTFIQKIHKPRKQTLSVIIPVFDEEGNIDPLYEKLRAVLTELDHPYEIIFINDGSADDTLIRLSEVARKDYGVKVINFKRNFGQTAAMMAGIDAACGDILIPMDGDLQNDPADIPKLLNKLKEGFDVCSGWRKDRKDNPLKRNLPSRIANWVISFISGVHLHDYGCSLKAYKREIIKGVRLYGEMHRFIPIYAAWEGARVAEVSVTHFPRVYGYSKYGIERTIKVILDLMVVKFLTKYGQKPMYVFGGISLVNFLLSLVCFGFMLYYKFAENITFIQTPLPLLSVLFFLMGFICLLMGFLSEMLMRTYFESQRKTTYSVDHTCNFEG